MALISSTVVDKNPQSHGRLRVSLEYTFSTGVPLIVGPITVDSEQEAQAQLIARQPSAVSGRQSMDAEEAMQLGIKTPYKEADQGAVYFAWLKTAFDVVDPAESYAFYREVGPVIMAMGLTVEQLASAFGSTVADAQAVYDRWIYLDTNSALIDSYIALKQGDSGA